MNIQDLNNLDPNDIGSWPTAVKAVAIVIVCVVVLAGGWYMDTQEQLVLLDQSKQAEQDKRSVFENKQSKAANLAPLRLQLQEMKQSFGAMLRQLPDKSEIEALLVDISQTGLAAGLEFELFKPEAESPAEFYAEQPIRLKVTGTYHQFGEFVSGVAALPRIVTQHDISIRPKSLKARQPVLVMEATAKTYRYLDEEG